MFPDCLLVVNEWYGEHEQVQTFISGNVRHDGVLTSDELCDCSVSLVHDRNAEKQHCCDTLTDTSKYKD